MRTKAVLQALLVTFLWSTSWVLIKIGLRADLPALTFAGLRYTLAFACLLPFVIFNPAHRRALYLISWKTWLKLVGLGVVLYTLTQGAQYASLAYLPAAMLSLILNLTSTLVALISSLTRHEPPDLPQWAGIGLTVAGAVVFFLPLELPPGAALGLLIALGCLLGNAVSALMGREVNQYSQLDPILVTTVSMGVGGLLLLVTGSFLQGFRPLEPLQWGLIVWLAVVNTAFAFTLWNRTLRVLTAVQSSVLNSLMMPQIALLAWLFLAEPLNLRQVCGVLLVGAGTLVVQWTGRASVSLCQSPNPAVRSQ